ncbi:MAG: STAS domain-containing protein [Magnetococcales bacterium]|nr:STAS domain-containing protein [Magnetococcales bacterium]NGZ27249.1 STAS domain-containing protein [Magnetococcales bacterium]
MKILFPSECTLDVMEEIKATLLGLLQQEEPVQLSFKEVERADLSFFQLLHVAVQTFRQVGKELVLLPDLPAALALKALATDWSQLVAVDNQPPENHANHR